MLRSVIVSQHKFDAVFFFNSKRMNMKLGKRWVELGMIVIKIYKNFQR